ncbi:secretin receptor-like, partial [Homalodisca vitripennis]|uniref:secretin receptor-like n=1 Tax=Homalodisca vitripennis TaxID=197043 RepID=UPI001EEC6C84
MHTVSGLPLFFVVPWVFVRALLEDTLCWTTNENSYFFQLIKGPTTASILVNLILFINIVRVLMSKLQASICEETRRFRYRRWAKSTLVLVPLFGVHYVVFLTISYLGIKGKVELIWLFIDQLFASFQVRTEFGAQEVATSILGFEGLPTTAPPSLSTPSSRPAKRSYLGTVFSRRRRRFRSHEKRLQER